MSNGLSQAEIDALLRGETPPETDSPSETAENTAEQPPETSKEDAGAQAEVSQPVTDAAEPAPKGAGKGKKSEESKKTDKEPALPVGENTMTPAEVDAMGEIGNISMGTAATTLFTMLNRRVEITTPRVSVVTIEQIAREYPMPFVGVQVSYTQGLEGTNLLFLQEKDVKIITDLLMGGDGTNTEGDLTDMHLSAICEVMNQMVGSSSTSLAQLMGMAIDISPPTAFRIDMAGNIQDSPVANIESPVVCTSFDMVVEGLINSEIMQIMPQDFAHRMVERLLSQPLPDAAKPEPAPAPAPAKAKPEAETKAAPAAKPAAKTPAKPAAPAHPASNPDSPVADQLVDVRPAQFGQFEDETPELTQQDENLDLLMDVPLSIAVELGRSKKYIREILDFNVGSIIVLDKMAGELVDVMVNGKLIARGEVVVIEDNYGVRITEILSPGKVWTTL